MGVGRGRLWGSIATHGFTASGAVLGLFALEAASRGEAASCFAWLGAALIVDGADGIAARHFRVWEALPRFSGERLDLIIDYLTYVIVPAFLLGSSQLLPDGLAWPLAALIAWTSLYHFADTHSKTDDEYFVGFPVIWNVVALYLYVWALPAWVNAAIVTVLVLATFVPLRFAHPIKVRHWRPATLGVTALWAIAAIVAVREGFPSSQAVQAIFAGAALYYTALSVRRGFGSAHQ